MAADPPYVATVGAWAAVTGMLVGLRPSLHLATVALIYLLQVFLAALLWGRGASLTAGLLSFLSLNYFFTVPYGTFRVASTQDVISLLVFLFVAEMTARLVTMLREREAEARQKGWEAAQVDALRKTDQLKSALLSAVSHDLRTPLSSIRIAATGLLQNELHANEEARRELLEMIDAEAARLARLVNNLLDLSRIEAGALTPEKEWTDLEEVAARAVDHQQHQAPHHRVVVDFPPSLPLVPLDFTQIENVLANLLDNAVRYSPEGTPIHVRARREDGEVVVQVENEGPPVPVEAASQIFERFYRVQRDGRGIGLGLAICKGLVEAHGGRIWVERPGESGARFAFALPVGEHPRTGGSR
ncbi:MAG TPA: ATP-binding protein [bacterium]